MYAQDIAGDIAPQLKVVADRKKFFYANWRVATFRPLLAVSSVNVKDPDGWRHDNEMTAAQRHLVIREFRKLVPRRHQCDQPETPPARNVAYRDDDVVITDAYRSADGRRVVGQTLNATRLDCNFFDDETQYDYWLLLNPDGSVRLLGHNMALVGAADVDGDGQSELVFHVAQGDDFDGYTLFYDHLAKQLEMGWTFH